MPDKPGNLHQCWLKTSVVFIILFFVVLLAALPGRAVADGCYVPPRLVAGHEQFPGLPHQRALLVYDSQAATETLVVESVMTAEKGERFAWLLPLPAAPTVINKVDPGVFTTLEFCLGPKIIGWRPTYLFPPTLILAIELLIMINFTIIQPWVKSVNKFAVLFFILWGGSLISVGDFPGPAARTNAGAKALRSEQVGSYDVAVLQAAGSGEVSAWLAAHQFAPLPPPAAGRVDQYLAEGWVLLAAQLRRTDHGELAPHPLRVTFPACEPVYPMRLTALGQTPTEVSLFAVTTRRDGPRLNAPGYETIYSGPFERFPIVDTDLAPLTNHQELAELIGPQGWISQLHARVAPAQMDRDLVFARETPPHEERQILYTPHGAMAQALMPLLWILAIVLPVIGVILFQWQRLGKWITTMLVLALLATAVIRYHHLPRYANARTLPRGYSFDQNYIVRMRGDLANFMAHDPPASGEAIRQRIGDYLRRPCRNEYTGEPMRLETSPGNFGFQTDGPEALRLVVYDWRCIGRNIETYRPTVPLK